MMLLKKLTLVSLVVLGVVACTDDKKKVEEVVQAPAAANADEVKVDKESGKVDFAKEVVYFEFDDSSLTKEGMSQLDMLAKYLDNNAAVKLTIEGNTDDRGSVEYNLALGQRRSEAVKKYLTTVGVKENRLATVSFGEEKPNETGGNEAAWAKNRRAEFVVVK